jgi:phage-related protein
VFDPVADFFIGIWNAIVSFFRWAWDTISAYVNAKLAEILGIITSAWNVVSGIFSSVWGAISSFFIGIWNKLSAYVNGKMAEIAGILSSAWNNISSGISNVVHAIWNTVSGVFNDIWNFISGFASRMFNAGVNVVQGLLNGIKSMLSNALSAIKNFFGGLIDGAKKALGIASPSKVFRVIGEFTGEGYVEGVDNWVSQAQASMNSLVSPNLTAAQMSALAGNTASSSDSAYSAASGAATTFTGDVHVSINASDIEDMQNVFDFFDNVEQQARAGV